MILVCKELYKEVEVVAMTETERRILENQEVILLALSRLLLSKCRRPDDAYIKTNVEVMHAYKNTRVILGKPRTK